MSHSVAPQGSFQGFVRLFIICVNVLLKMVNENPPWSFFTDTTWKLSNASLLFNVMTLLTDTHRQTFWLFIACQVAGNFKSGLECNLVGKLELKQLSTADCMDSGAYCSFYTCTHLYTHAQFWETSCVNTWGSKSRGKHHSMEEKKG